MLARFSTALSSSISTMTKVSWLACWKNSDSPWARRLEKIPRLPTGAKKAASTTCIASALVLTWGTTIPLTPRSKVRVINPGSLVWTRVIDDNPQRSQARDRSPRLSQVTDPCSPSSQMPSNPRGPRKSMVSLVLLCPPTAIVVPPLVSFSLTRFPRIGFFSFVGNQSAWTIRVIGTVFLGMGALDRILQSKRYLSFVIKLNELSHNSPPDRIFGYHNKLVVGSKGPIHLDRC